MGPVRRALHGLKYAGEQRVAPVLGQALAARWRAAGAGGDLVVPVPVHAARLRERGYDQAALLAAAAARELHLPWREAVARTRATTPQYRLDRGRRALNMEGAFGPAPDPAVREVAGHWVILVDDVITTGATMREAAEVLLAMGAAAVSGLAVARER